MEIKEVTLREKTASHPCFGEHACNNARIHLPVAPKCNVQCNYCLRKYDCANESRPGVASKVLSPVEAFNKYVEFKEKLPNLTVVGIAGPGDALANFEETKKTLELIRAYDKEVTFCVSTNGLMLPVYADELIRLGVSHITVTMNTVSTEIAAKIYKFVNYDGEIFTGLEAGALILANQLSGIKKVVAAGAICKINCVVLNGINETHIKEVSKKAKELGVFMTNIMPHIPVEGSGFAELAAPSAEQIDNLRNECEVNIKQMRHCRQCRADAVGTLGNDLSVLSTACGLSTEKSVTPQKETGEIKRFAAATKNGTMVDLHFGHAEEFYIYETDGAEVTFIEKREVAKYCTGQDDCGEKEERFDAVIKAIEDCKGVIALRIGYGPQEILKQAGFLAVVISESVENAVRTAYSM
ncbi:hypothetical protein FACS1894188_04200 [Clostridia bacterium]|nr:hypothetical protein FACS1894188_04200 [Clostridia bacterium]